MGLTMFTILEMSNPSPNNVLKTLTFSIRTYCTESYSMTNPNLYSRISPLGNPKISVVPVLDQWVDEGRKVSGLELKRLIRDLRRRRRYTHALEISEWMSAKGLCPFYLGDRAIQLDLLGKVRGLSAAENYFNSMSDQEKIDKIYGALLNCYIREGRVDQALNLLQKMNEMGFLNSPLTYNNLMCLYVQTGQLEKIPDVLSEMKKNGVSPNIFSYKICINSYGTRSDLNNMERILAEMESERQISKDWSTYSTVANIYIKAGFSEKALVYLKKSEEKLYNDSLGYDYLISLYASLGKKDEVMRLWGLLKASCKKQINRDYRNMMVSLVKIGEFKETEILLKEWESSCQCYDFRVPNILLIGYCQKGLIEKAEDLLKDIIERGKTPIPNSWAIISSAYLDKQNMEKALVYMKEALKVYARNQGWRPKPKLISGILSWIGDNREVEEVESFVNSLKTVVKMDREMYHALIKANIRGGREVGGILEAMNGDEIAADEETVLILSSRQVES